MLTKESLEFLLEMLNRMPTSEEIVIKSNKIVIKSNKTGEVLRELSREDLEDFIAIENSFEINKDQDAYWYG